MTTSYQIKKIFSIFSANNPNPETELKFSSAYECLVAVILSAQATDIGVNKATDKLFKLANTPEAMVALGEEGLREEIKTIGLYRSKANHVIKMSKMLIDLHQSKVPNKREALQALPGVGRKTANVILNVVFSKSTIAVDTHIFRVSHRLGFSLGKTPEAVEKDLLKIIPEKYLYHAHHWLILHGRYVCKARKPMCASCPVSRYCSFEKMMEDK